MTGRDRDLPLMQVWINDYIAATYHLDIESHGVFFSILINTWKRRGKPFAVDGGELRQVLRINREKQWQRIKKKILHLFDTSQGTFKSPILENMWQKAIERSEQSSRAANKRWAKERKNTDTADATASNGHCQPELESEQVLESEQELKLKQVLDPEPHKKRDIKQSLQCDEYGHGSYKK